MSTGANKHEREMAPSSKMVQTIEKILPLSLHFSKQLRSSREKLKEGLSSRASLERLLKPEQELSSMQTLEFPACLANRNRALLRGLQLCPLFVQKRIGEQGQAPETHERLGTHELILVQAQLLLPIGKKDLDIPACADMLYQAFNRSLH